MNINMKVTYVMELEGQELTIISKALTGSLSKAERKTAVALAKRMADQRAAQAATAHEIAGGALLKVGQMGEMGDWPEEPK